MVYHLKSFLCASFVVLFALVTAELDFRPCFALCCWFPFVLSFAQTLFSWVVVSSRSKLKCAWSVGASNYGFCIYECCCLLLWLHILQLAWSMSVCTLIIQLIVHAPHLRRLVLSTSFIIMMSQLLTIGLWWVISIWLDPQKIQASRASHQWHMFLREKPSLKFELESWFCNLS